MQILSQSVLSSKKWKHLKEEYEILIKDHKIVERKIYSAFAHISDVSSIVNVPLICRRYLDSSFLSSHRSLISARMETRLFAREIYPRPSLLARSRIFLVSGETEEEA